MPSIQADPSNFADLLAIVRDGYEICLTPGEYKGSFAIERAIAIRGAGADTVIFATDEPALVIKVPGVRLENLAIERTVGGDTGEIVLLAEPGTKPILERVKLRGIALNVRWEGTSWDIPPILDFGEIETNRQVQRSWQLQIGDPGEIVSDLNWLHVQPTYLSPGLQTIEIVLNSRDIPAGTNLSGFIFLGSEDEIREIEISAQIKASDQTPILQGETRNIHSFPTKEEELGYEDCGYRFVGDKSINNLICDLEGKDALEGYWEFEERRDRAEVLLGAIVGQNPCLFYLRRQGQGQQPGEEKCSLTIATDRDDIKFPEILAQREKTLNLLAVISEDGSGGLRLLSARLVAPEQGKADGFTVPCCLRLLPDRRYRIGVPDSLLSSITELPFCGDYLPTESQLKAWQTFLNIEERIAKERQFCVPLIGHNYGSATRKLTFKIDATKATIDSSSGTFLKGDNFWQRAAKARNEDIKLLEVNPDGDGEQIEYLLGSIESIDREKSFIRIRLNSEIVDKIVEGRYQIPQNGFLSFEAAGDITQIKRKKRALDELKKGNTQNPYLGEFFFEAAKARATRRTIKLEPENLLLPAANPDQIAAVETVLSADDLVLIQGPPGTGKTTVIAEICYQIALRGGRTLIASQANLAVDNALSRLIHSPVIRALRKGRASRVEEEGLPFLEEQVIGTWLQNTANDCEHKLAKRKENIEFFRQLLASSERFKAYLRAEEAIERNQRTWQDRKVNLENNCQTVIREKAELEEQQRQVQSLIPELNSLLASAPSVNWEDAGVVNLLQRLRQYAADDSYVKNFIANTQAAVKLANKIGLVSPALREVFGLTDWLRDRLPILVSETSPALACGRDAIAAITAAETAAQIYLQQSATVKQLQRNYQQNLTQPSQQQQTHNQQNLQLDASWQRLLENTQPITVKILLEQHGCLLSLERNSAIVAISFEPLLKLIKPKRPAIEAAFCKTFNQQISVSLVVGNSALRSEYRQQQPSIQQQNWLANLKRQVSDAQRQLEYLRQDAEIKARRCRGFLTELNQFSQLPDALRAVVDRCLQSTSIYTVLTHIPELKAQVNSWENDINNLNRLNSLLNPLAGLSNIKNSLANQLSKLQQASATANRQLADIQNQLRQIEAQLQQKPSEKLIAERKWWETAWKAIPERIKPQVSSNNLFEPNFLRSVKAQFDAWKKELEKEQAYLSRYENIVQDWIEKLRNPSAQDQSELRRIYIDNANVIGITCSQAAGYSFAREFNNFDVVIIDEVSKCTPPELLIPALKGKKLVLIGDYRQLPPMLHENTIEEIAEEMGSTAEDLAFLQESLFKKQFETAPESIKQRLTIQYRMHPIIMGAINQFYDHRLQCGILEPDKQRAHNLAGNIIQENNHLIWVKMPLQQGFEEQEEGTSKINIKEVDALEIICQQIEAAWSEKVTLGQPKKEIGIITFYGAQLRLIEERIDAERFPSLHIRTGTVDRFQGMERPVIIVSMVRNNSKRDVGFAKKLERVNVAFSRAQELLVVVGCHSLFTQYSMYANISDIVRRHGGLIDVSKILSS